MRDMFRRNKKGLIIYRTGFFLKRDVEVVGERLKSVGGYSIEKSTADHDSRDKTWPALLVETASKRRKVTFGKHPRPFG